MIAKSSLSSSVWVDDGFGKDFSSLRWASSGVVGRLSESTSTSLLDDEALESLGLFVVADFFDDIVVLELAICRLEQNVRDECMKQAHKCLLIYPFYATPKVQVHFGLHLC